MILTDDQPPYSLSGMPNTLRRFRGGLNLTSTGYCAVPLCGPARVSLLTGLYPHNHGAITNTAPNTFAVYRERGLENSDLLARMRRAGYTVGFYGKFLNGYGSGTDNGRFVHPSANGWYVLKTGQNRYPYDVNANGKTISGLTEQHTTHFSDRARRFITNQKDAAAPWLCCLNLVDPHAPYKPAKTFEHSHDGEQHVSPGTEETDFSDKTGVYAPPSDPTDPSTFQRRHEGITEELELADVWVERLFAALETTGQLDNTIVVYSSDNGQMVGEHGGMQSKNYPYEESVRTPFLVRGPGIPTTVPTDPLVSHVDIPATILRAGGARTAQADGRPLQELSRGNWRRRLLAESPALGWSLVREGRWVYMALPGGHAELYDVRTDPYQLESRHRDPGQADRMADLAGKVKALASARGRTEYAALEA